VEPVKRKNERENKMEPNTKDAVMQICNLNVFYDGKPVLHDVFMNIRRNRITAILGSSGCGKTTFLKTLNGLLE
jgi:phosphate transport system ATP-binding protein